MAFTKEEIEKVERFHNNKIREKIRHYPIPLNRSGWSYGIVTTQYRKEGEDWVVDPDIHDNCNDVRTPAKSFEDAKDRPAKVESFGRIWKRELEEQAVRASDTYGYGSITGYETLGRTIPARNGRNYMAVRDRLREEGRDVDRMDLDNY